MKLIQKGKLRVLEAEKGYHFRDINDEYVPEHIDPETGETIPEHEIYWMTECYPGIQIQTLEDAEKIFVEEKISE